MFRALGHFSKFARRGAVKIASAGDVNGLLHCAFENPDGSIAVVVTNQGVERSCDVAPAGKVANMRLPADSVMTMVTGAPQR